MIESESIGDAADAFNYGIAEGERAMRVFRDLLDGFLATEIQPFCAQLIAGGHDDIGPVLEQVAVVFDTAAAAIRQQLAQPPL